VGNITSTFVQGHCVVKGKQRRRQCVGISSPTSCCLATHIQRKPQLHVIVMDEKYNMNITKLCMVDVQAEEYYV